MDTHWSVHDNVLDVCANEKKKKFPEQDLNVNADIMIGTMDQPNESMGDGDDNTNVNDNDSVHGEGEGDEEDELEDMIPDITCNLSEIHPEEYLTFKVVLPNKDVGYMMLKDNF